MRKPSARTALISGGILVLLIAILVGVALWSPLCAIRTITVEGLKHSNREDIIEASGLQEGDNLLRIDSTRAAQGVASLPWTRSVTVSRDLPSTAVIRITERKAPLYREEQGSAWLIDENGDVFLQGDPPPDSLAVSGPGAEDGETLAEVARALGEVGSEQRSALERVEISADKAMTLYIKDGGRTVYWGAPENNRNKAIALESVLTFPDGNWNISNPELLARRDS